MITSEDTVTYPNVRNKVYGYTSLYECSRDCEISSGVVLVGNEKGTEYIFQLSKTVNIFENASDTSAFYVEGSVVEYLEEPSEVEDLPPFFKMSLCRFPTIEELAWYEDICTV